jgi:hypothetical protein
MNIRMVSSHLSRVAARYDVLLIKSEVKQELKNQISERYAVVDNFPFTRQ